MTKPNPITAGREALVARLGTINTAAGYLTNAGANVHTGWLNEVIKASKFGFPLLVVQPGRSQPPVLGPGAVKIAPGFRIVGAVEAGNDYETALEDLQLDLLRCLMPGHKQFLNWLPLGVTGLQLGPVDFYPPGEGLACATVLLPVYLTTVIQQ